MEQVQLLCWILDVRVNKKGECLAVDVFDCDLEAVEASGFRCRYFGDKFVVYVLVDNAVGGGKERKDVGDEVEFLHGCHVHHGPREEVGGDVRRRPSKKHVGSLGWGRQTARRSSRQ
jgi:hypothetical protein